MAGKRQEIEKNVEKLQSRQASLTADLAAALAKAGALREVINQDVLNSGSSPKQAALQEANATVETLRNAVQFAGDELAKARAELVEFDKGQKIADAAAILDQLPEMAGGLQADIASILAKLDTVDEAIMAARNVSAGLQWGGQDREIYCARFEFLSKRLRDVLKPSNDDLSALPNYWPALYERRNK